MESLRSKHTCSPCMKSSKCDGIGLEKLHISTAPRCFPDSPGDASAAIPGDQRSKWILATWTRRPAFRVKIVGNLGRDWTLFREVGIRDDANSLLSDLRTENTQRSQRQAKLLKRQAGLRLGHIVFQSHAGGGIVSQSSLRWLDQK